MADNDLITDRDYVRMYTENDASSIAIQGTLSYDPDDGLWINAKVNGTKKTLDANGNVTSTSTIKNKNDLKNIVSVPANVKRIAYEKNGNEWSSYTEYTKFTAISSDSGVITAKMVLNVTAKNIPDQGFRIVFNDSSEAQGFIYETNESSKIVCTIENKNFDYAYSIMNNSNLTKKMYARVRTYSDPNRSWDYDVIVDTSDAYDKYTTIDSIEEREDAIDFYMVKSS